MDKEEKKLSPESKPVTEPVREALEKPEFKIGKEPTDAEKSSALRQQIASLELDKSAKISALKQAQNLQNLKENEQLERLLKIAEKDVVKAKDIANKMKSPFLVDRLHDELVKRKSKH